MFQGSIIPSQGNALEPDVVTCNSLIKAQNSLAAWPVTLQTLSEIALRALRADLVRGGVVKVRTLGVEDVGKMG